MRRSLILCFVLLVHITHGEVTIKTDQRLVLIETQQWILKTSDATYKINKDLRDNPSLLLNQFAWNKDKFSVDLNNFYQSIVNQVTNSYTKVFLNISNQKLRLFKNSKAVLTMDLEISNPSLKQTQSIKVQCKSSWQNPSNGVIKVSKFEYNLMPAKTKRTLLKVSSNTLDKDSLASILNPILQTKKCEKIASYYLFSCKHVKADIPPIQEYTINFNQEKSSYFSDNYILGIDKELLTLDDSTLKSFVERSLHDRFFNHQRVNHEFQKELMKSTKVNLFLNVSHIDHKSTDTLRKYIANLIMNQYKQALIAPI